VAGGKPVTALGWAIAAGLLVSLPACANVQESDKPLTSEFFASEYPGGHGLTFGVGAFIIESVLGCTNARPVPKNPSRAAPTSTQSDYCTFKGATVRVDTWGSQAEIEQVEAGARGMASRLGGVTIAVGTGWTVSPYEREVSARTFPADKAISRAVIAKIGGTIFEVDP
jgi:hypothetical protein